MGLVSRYGYDNVVIVTRDGDTDQTWDGKVKNLIYDVDSMGWVAQEAGATSGGGGDASAANQVTEISKLTSILDKTAGAMVPYSFDYVGVTYTSSTVETYVYKTGGAGGTTAATVTITYTDASKEYVSTVART